MDEQKEPARFEIASNKAFTGDATKFVVENVPGMKEHVFMPRFIARNQEHLPEILEFLNSLTGGKP